MKLEMSSSEEKPGLIGVEFDNAEKTTILTIRQGGGEVFHFMVPQEFLVSRAMLLAFSNHNEIVPLIENDTTQL